MANRIICPACGYANTDHRNSCKQCHVELTEAKVQARGANAVTIQSSDSSQQRPEVQKVAQDLADILTDGEQILYIALQGMKAGIRKDAVVATDRRVIFYRPALMGRFNFTDHLWHDVKDAKLNQGMMSSELRVQTTKGGTTLMGNLDKDQARKVYGICQRYEEEWRERRRQRQMEEDRARAGSVVVQSGQSAPAPTAAAPAEDPVARLAKAKAMLDQGLISQAEYDDLKGKIMSAI